MTTTYIEDIGKHVGGEVTLRGWVHNKRSSGKIQFLIVRDGTGYIQAVVVKNAVSPEIFAAAACAATTRSDVFRCRSLKGLVTIPPKPPVGKMTWNVALVSGNDW